ncbi:CHASE domain-containing protein [Marinomonas sp. IMCC 4694]|uniref:CHASE domain-containing protein n=1 Tax=Marinomonas sp. IMCC 4694 TaxID=2605432 RepID=UPI001652E3DE|nr:CHASE domain-containing protein [Marinomonas sp. IMCC 4694]
MEENVVAHMEMYQYGLMGVRGALFAVAESNLSRDVFYRYNLTRDIDNEFPGALGFGFIRRVPADKIAPFLAKAKADGRADFRVKELSPNAGERYVIEYIEPVARNFAALGLDIASEPNLYQTAYSAMQSGEVRLTGPITLVQPDGSGRRSFLMLLPLYRDITLPNSVAEREAQAFGWSYAPLIIDDVLADVGILDNDHFVLDIYDVTDPSAPERLFSNNALNAQGANAVIATVRVYGRDWQFDLTATPTFFENANLLSPLLVGILGSIAAFIMALLAGFMEANYNHKRGFTKQRDRLAALVESSADGIIALSLDGTVKSWNKAAEQLFGYTNEEAINKDITQLIIATPFRHEHSVQLKLVALGESLSSVHTLRYKKDGSSIDVSITLSPIYSDEGVVVAASKTVRDISAQKVAEAKVRELNESLEYQVFERTSEIASLNTLFENVLMAASDFAIIATDLEGNIQLFNRGAEHLLGYQAEDMVGKKTPLVFHSQKELTDRYASSFDQPNAGPIQDFQILLLMAHKNSEYQEWHYLHKDGHVIDVKLVLTQMLDAKGKISGYLFIAVDITEQKRKHIELLTTQRQLLSRTEQLMMVYYVAELGIWEWVLEDSSLIWNNKMFEFYEQPTSLNQSELNYSHWESRIHPEDRQLTATQLNDAVMGKGDFNTVFRLLLPSGQLRYIQGGAYIQRNAEGEALRVVGINRDITAQREFEFKLRESKNIADTANAAKSMFLANMSHEIRTPMNAVLGMLQLIRTTELSMQQNSYADKAQIAAQSLLKLIDDILDFSKIESDKLELEKYPFTTEDLLNELAAVLTPNLGNKNVELLFDIDPLLPDRFEGDRQRLQQVLINLANNAIKFTDHGEIIVKIERLQLQDTACLVRFNVMDTGIGISQTQQQTVFDIFTQSEVSTSRKYGGSGLGLAISKRIVLLMGSEIQLQSEVGKGSHFWFDVALCVADASSIKEKASPFLSQDKNVLIVNTNDICLSILKSTVEQYGPNVVMARSGEKAVQQIDSSIAKKNHASGCAYRISNAGYQWFRGHTAD